MEKFFHKLIKINIILPISSGIIACNEFLDGKITLFVKILKYKLQNIT